MKTLNALVDKFKSLSLAGELTNEESVKNYIIRDMVEKVWNYEYGPGADHYKVEVDLPQIGTKVAHSRCDYMLWTNNFSVIIEAKAFAESVENGKHIDELASYVHNMLADMGILTNGKKWALFLAGQDHIMEKKPFKVFDLETISDDEKKYVISLFRTPGASLDVVRKVYEEGKKKAEEQELMTKIENAIIEERKYLSNDEKKNIIRKVEPNTTMVTQAKLESYENYFKAALMNVVEKEKNKYREAVKKEMEQYRNDVEIEERAVFHLTLGLLADEFDVSNVNLSDFESGVLAKIHFGGPKSGQPIMWVCGKILDNKYRFEGIAFPLPNGQQGELVSLLQPKDILNHKDRIREEARISARGPRKKDAKSNEASLNT
jgi:hypothetical protein